MQAKELQPGQLFTLSNDSELFRCVKPMWPTFVGNQMAPRAEDLVACVTTAGLLKTVHKDNHVTLFEG